MCVLFLENMSLEENLIQYKYQNPKHCELLIDIYNKIFYNDRLYF